MTKSHFRDHLTLTFNSLSFSRIHFELTIYFANSLSLHSLLREFISDSLSGSRIRYLFRAFTIFFADQLSISRIHFHFTMNSLLLCDFTSNSLYFSRIHFQFNMFFRDVTSNSLYFREFLIFSRIYFEFTIF